MTKLKTVPRWHTLKNLLKFVDNPVPILQESIDQYGNTYRFFVGGLQEGIVSVEPEFAQHVLQKNHRNYKKSKIQTDELGKYVGNGLLTAEGPYWLKQRRLIQPGFHRKKIASLFDQMNDVIALKAEQFLEAAAEEKTFDISHEMMELAFRVVASSLFGTDIHKADVDLLENLLETVQQFLIREIRQPYLSWYFKLTGKTKQHIKLADSGKELMLKYIQRRKESNLRQDDLLDMLINAKYEDSDEGMSNQQLIDESLILFVAGHETTAVAMTWMWYLLSQHPQAVQKLREEIQEITDNGSIKFDDLQKLDFVTAVINETMRLYPPAWILDRIAIEDDEIMGIPIKKGTMVIPWIYGVHRSKDIWDSPHEFKPERFLKANASKIPKYAFFPFGGGPRMCIGSSFAMMEMQMILCHFVQKFDFELIEQQKVDIKPMVTLRARYGMKMKVRLAPS